MFRAARCACHAYRRVRPGRYPDDLELTDAAFRRRCLRDNAACARRPVLEKVITLRPQLDFRAATASSRVLKEEEPFHCVSCGKPFGVKSSIERVAAKLEGKHWMYKNSAKRLDVIKMCADCRVITT